jgi:hypothetical protein
MLFRVAALLGRTVEELLASDMSSEEFSGWCAMYDLEPWGFQARAWAAGTVASTVANYAGRSRKKPDAKPSDWMLKSGKKRRQSAREMKQALSKAASNG